VSGASVEFDGDQRPIWGVKTLNVEEDATPLDADDMSGGVGQIDVSIPESAERNAATVRKRTIVVEHHGTTTAGVVNTATDNGALLSISANGPQYALNVSHVIPPYHGTLGGFFDLLLDSCGLTGVTEAEITARPVTIPGGRMNVLDRIKEVCAAQQVEMEPIDGVLTLQRPRQHELDLDAISHGPISRTMDDGELARTIAVSYYSPQNITDGLIYPLGGWTEGVAVYSLDAGESQEIEIELNASISSVKQPTCVSSVSRDYVGPDSVYCVAGSDGLIIPPAQWKEGGGKVEVRIDEDTRKLIVTITASAQIQYAPYSLRMPSGETEGYSSLRIVGSGVSFEEEQFTIRASVDPEVQTEVGTTIQNECIATWNQAFNVGLRTSQRFAGPKKTIAFLVTSDTVVRRGMRVRYRDTYYRIRSLTRGLATTRVTAEADTTIADHNAAWAGKTTADWNAHYAGKEALDQASAPLSVS
jgi:hypothetical protein